MCEYDPICTKRDHELAAGLWKRRRDAAWLVRCPREYHPIGAVFDLPTRGRVLCCPAYTVRWGSMFADPQPDGTPLADPDELYHLHADVRPLDDYGPTETERGRCHCGTWSYRPATMDPAQFGHVHHDTPYVLASYVSVADSTRNRLRAESAARSIEAVD